MFSSGHRNGIFILILIILVLQLIIFNFNKLIPKDENQEGNSSNQKWLSFQSKIDSLKSTSKNQEYKLQPFNPNYISDYKGYMLGMSLEEIDRLHKFRQKGKFINSISDFKKVTNVSDSLLNKISPYFKFPDWVVAKSNSKKDQHQFFEKNKIERKNINQASKEELMKVYGIGDKLSDIILKDKEKFGEFVTIEQLKYVWGITPETFENITKRFFVERTQTPITKLKINEASTKELSQFPYFNYKIAKEIVTQRSMNGSFAKVEDLTKINDFPVEKIEIIVLYLEIN